MVQNGEGGEGPAQRRQQEWSKKRTKKKRGGEKQSIGTPGSKKRRGPKSVLEQKAHEETTEKEGKKEIDVCGKVEKKLGRR